VVCIASAEAGDTSQDLKTGYLLGATPIKQRFAFLIGITVSTFAIGVTLNLMNQGLQEFKEAPRAWNLSVPHPGVAIQQDPRGLMDQFTVKGPNNSTSLHHKSEYVVLNALGSSELADGKYLYSPATGRIEVQWIPGIGSEKAAAPQARLMATVINGILSRNCPGTGHAGSLPGHRRRTAGGALALVRRGRVSVDRDNAGHLHRRRGALPRGLGGKEGWRLGRGRRIGRLAVRIGTHRRGWHHGPGWSGFQVLRNHMEQDNPIGLPQTFLYRDWVSVIAFLALAFSLYYFARKPLKK